MATLLLYVGHMGLITELLVRRSANGKPLSPGIQVLAALNPYRLRQKLDSSATPGLVFQLHSHTSTPDPMSALVYRVHPIPASLQGFIFDFGALTAEKEYVYIESMISSMVADVSPEERKWIADLITVGQQFIRKYEGDPSATSLRDVRRCLLLLNWMNASLAGSAQSTISHLALGTVIGLSFAYYYRIPCTKSKSL